MSILFWTYFCLFYVPPVGALAFFFAGGAVGTSQMSKGGLINFGNEDEVHLTLYLFL